MKFSDITGQDDLKKQLIRMVNEGKMAHASIFLEKEGCGALAITLALSAYICCENRTGNDSCGICKSCIQHAKLVHPDLHFAFPVNSSKASEKKPVSEMFIEKWRELVLDNPYLTEQDLYDGIGIDNKSGIINVSEAQKIIYDMSLKPYEADYKIMLIWLPERMNQEAANKLLKLLEEPPAKTLFFLVCNSTDRILPTILSRCRIIRVPAMTAEELADNAVKRLGMKHDEALSLAYVSEGSYSELLKKKKEAENEGEFTEIMDTLIRKSLNRNLKEVLYVAEELAEMKREKQKKFCKYAGNHIRQLFMTKNGMVEISGILPSERKRMEAIAGKIPENFFENIHASLGKAAEHIERNVNGKLIFNDLCNRFFVSLQSVNNK